MLGLLAYWTLSIFYCSKHNKQKLDEFPSSCEWLAGTYSGASFCCNQLPLWPKVVPVPKRSSIFGTLNNENIPGTKPPYVQYTTVRTSSNWTNTNLNAFVLPSYKRAQFTILSKECSFPEDLIYNITSDRGCIYNRPILCTHLHN